MESFKTHIKEKNTKTTEETLSAIPHYKINCRLRKSFDKLYDLGFYQQSIDH